MNRKLVLLTSAIVAFVVGIFDIQVDQYAAAQNSQARGKTKASMKRGAKGKPAPPKTNLPTGAEKTKVDIAPVKPELRDAAMRSAAKIDTLVEAGLKKAGQKPNEMSSPEHFVRRVYLDITGTIPTSKLTESFLGNKSESARIVLIDGLLNRPGYASQMYNWMADILRLVDKAGNDNYLRPYSDWVKECLQDNESWDAMVHDMLTAEGRVWDEPAAGSCFAIRGCRWTTSTTPCGFFSARASGVLSATTIRSTSGLRRSFTRSPHSRPASSTERRRRSTSTTKTSTRRRARTARNPMKLEERSS